MATTQWALDPTHSEIQFKVKHLMISKVTGQFKNFTANVETAGNDFTTAKIHFEADVDSIDTNNEQRDAHLKNGDFFDVGNHPKLTFKGEKLERVDDENYLLHGTLTMRGKSRKETFKVEYGGTVSDPWGMTRAGFTLTGKINRMDYGVSFGAVSETGGIMLGEEVSLNAQAEFVKSVEAAVAA